MHLTLTLQMATAQVVETSVNCQQQQSYSGLRPGDHTQSTYEMTPGFKPFTVIKNLFSLNCNNYPKIYRLFFQTSKNVAIGSYTRAFTAVQTFNSSEITESTSMNFSRLLESQTPEKDVRTIYSAMIKLDHGN